MRRFGVRIFSAALAGLMAFMSLDVNAMAAQPTYENVVEEAAETDDIFDGDSSGTAGISELEKQLQAIENGGNDQIAENTDSEGIIDSEAVSVDEDSDIDEDTDSDLLSDDGESIVEESNETPENRETNEDKGIEHEILTKGVWNYYIDEDGRAHITGNSNTSLSSVNIPNKIGNSYVVSIEENAFSDFSALSSISIPFYINFIGENAFGNDVTIKAYWGTYALNYASEHGYKYENKSKLDFADGVIDFSDIDRSHFSYITSTDIEMNSLEASCLHEGSVFYMPSSTENINGDGFKVLQIKEKDEETYILYCERALGKEILNSIVFNENNIKPSWDDAIIYYDADNNGVYEEYALSEMNKEGDDYYLDGEAELFSDGAGFGQLHYSYSSNLPTGSFSISQGNSSISIDINAVINANADINLLAGKVNNFQLDMTSNYTVSASETGKKKSIESPSKDGKFPLAKVPVQSTGLETIYVIFSVGISVEGSVSISYSISQNCGWLYQNGSMHFYHSTSGNGSIEAAITGKVYFEVELLLSACGILSTSVAVQGGLKVVGSASMGIGDGAIPKELALTVSLYAELKGSFNLNIPCLGDLIDVDKSISWEHELCRKSFLPEGGKYTVRLINTRTPKLTSITANAGEKIKQPQIDAVNGQAIVGWYKDSKYTQQWDFDKDTVKGDMYLYAKWAKAVKVTYVYPTETKLISRTVLSAQGARLDMPYIPKVMNYMYIGCYKDSKYTNSWDFIKDKVSNTNMTIYVKYIYRKGYNPWKTGGISGEGNGSGSGTEAQIQTYILEYTESSGELTVTGIKTIAENLNIEIPNEWNGCPVTQIGSEAFKENDAILSVSIPSSVRVIYSKAFNHVLILKK